jgi:putative acetyltransferase
MRIERERADSADAIVLLRARDAELDALYPPENRFSIPIQRHADANIVFFVARDDGVPVGCGALQQYPGYAELKSIYVVPEARDKGVATNMVRTLEAFARDAGFLEAKLETGIRSPAAIYLYEKAGYRRCSRFGDYPDAPLSVFMEKTL